MVRTVSKWHLVVHFLVLWCVQLGWAAGRIYPNILKPDLSFRLIFVYLLLHITPVKVCVLFREPRAVDNVVLGAELKGHTQHAPPHLQFPDGQDHNQS